MRRSSFETKPPASNSITHSPAEKQPSSVSLVGLLGAWGWPLLNATSVSGVPNVNLAPGQKLETISELEGGRFKQRPMKSAAGHGQHEHPSTTYATKELKSAPEQATRQLLTTCCKIASSQRLEIPLFDS